MLIRNHEIAAKKLVRPKNPQILRETEITEVRNFQPKNLRDKYAKNVKNKIKNGKIVNFYPQIKKL